MGDNGAPILFDGARARKAERCEGNVCKLDTTAICAQNRGTDRVPWQISGSYLEACNCEAVCPCRRVDGVSGGRSTYGECLAALSWSVTKGHAGETDLADMRVVLAGRYHDDEPRSPWTFALFVDARGEQEQRQAIADIFTGRLGGTPRKQFPWVFKDADLVGVEALEIEIDHTPGRGWFRAGGKVEVRIRGPVADQGTVTCMIPGHHRHGRELFTESLDVHTGPLVFSVQGRCAYETTFKYSSDDG